MEPWYTVATPRKEVREGRSFNPDEFAIHLEQVIAKTAPEDYREPEQFFARTCFTRALREHAGMVLRRLSGETANTAPVMTLITQFGGGKTHTLTALYHLVTIPAPWWHCYQRGDVPAGCPPAWTHSTTPGADVAHHPCPQPNAQAPTFPQHRMQMNHPLPQYRRELPQPAVPGFETHFPVIRTVALLYPFHPVHHRNSRHSSLFLLSEDG